ncbi:hypothetical protein HN371_15490 [Candidatus Poribacteria bacterium]|jgi:DNA-binding Xre family transcriptional regulator|nr:hypothetical protein [Candidatus Poribacteria bacterium]MBT5535516.1 hypothetical protein [Candidatus Poribacteria bacterium]MBT5712779.1 hypothetical protein [Candidatus Poribacteria bacterium]MBT7100754.1 hypothetical protein [Candidatus Poribacteria bacterium]MBT7803958.1 hypothetical protein [Candidatus Poribacteria bacterium]
MSTSHMPPVSALASLRTPNIDKLNAVVASRRTSLGKLARTVGSSTLYRALLVEDSRTQRQALSQVCVALRCSLNDVSDLSD